MTQSSHLGAGKPHGDAGGGSPNSVKRNNVSGGSSYPHIEHKGTGGSSTAAVRQATTLMATVTPMKAPAWAASLMMTRMNRGTTRKQAQCMCLLMKESRELMRRTSCELLGTTPHSAVKVHQHCRGW